MQTKETNCRKVQNENKNMADIVQFCGIFESQVAFMLDLSDISKKLGITRLMCLVMSWGKQIIEEILGAGRRERLNGLDERERGERVKRRGREAKRLKIKDLEAI